MAQVCISTSHNKYIQWIEKLKKAGGTVNA
jgi:hypothetical protein